MHTLSSGTTAAAPPRTSGGTGRHTARPTARAVVPAATTTSSSRIAATSTASPPTAAPTSLPATRPSRAVAPTPPPAPAVVPPAALTHPTTAAKSATVGATSPDGAVLSFYGLVSRHQYDAAAALWSSTMKANYPPSTNIYGRFDQTRQVKVQITSVSQGTGTATVGVALSEQKADGSVNGYVGSWHLVQGASGWLLDSVDLTSAPVSSGAAVGQNVQDQGKHKGHGANGNDG
jgi:hypothetical protein